LTVPSTSSALTNNYLPGAWVETAPSAGTYEFWTGLSSASNSWIYTSIGQPRGATDNRVKFLKTFGSGIIQFGENVDLSATYATVAAQAGTYANATLSCTYTWANNVVTVSTGSTAHLLESGMQIGLDFTSGGATSYDNIYTLTVLNAYSFSVPLTGSGAGGNATARAGITITFTAHGLYEGESVYCDFTSGTGADGNYTVWRRTSANAYVIAYPLTANLTTGNVSCYHTATVTYTSHGLAVGNRVYLDFTSGTLTDGEYTVKTVATNTFNINVAHSAATNGNVTIQLTLGQVPASGCKVRIPNIFIAECATASRAANSVPNATIASRPQLTTSAAGEVDLEYLTALSFYTGAVGQAFAVRLYHCAFQDTLNLSEIASALDIDDVGVGMYTAGDYRAVQLTSCFAGGTVKNVVGQRGGAAGSSDHAMEVSYCNGTTLENIKAGIIRYARSTGIPFSIAGSQNITINGITSINGTGVLIATSVNVTVNDLDYVDRYIGRTNATTPYYCMNITAGCDQIALDGLTVGLNGTIPDCHPYSGLVYAVGATNLTFRNFGTRSSPVSLGAWAVDTYGAAYAVYPAGNNNTVKFQKIYVTRARTGLIYTLNSNKNLTYDRVYCLYPWINSGTGTPRTLLTSHIADLNASIKAVNTGAYPATGQTSVYGTHFYDLFLGDVSGALVLAMNEPIAETTNYFTVNAGAVLFNSSGGVEMRAVGAQATWEMNYFSKGHTAFANITPVMTGGTIGNYTLEYQIDINDGNGWNGSWKSLTGANLSGEDISLGFKLKIRITTTTINTTAITYLRLYTVSTASAQNSIDYPLDLATITINNLVVGSTYEVYNVTTASVLTIGTAIDDGGDPDFTSVAVTGIASEDDVIRVRVRKSSSTPKYIPVETQAVIENLAASVYINQILDPMA